MRIQARPATLEDDLAPLLHAASPDLYDIYFGGAATAVRSLRRLARRAGHNAGYDVGLVVGEPAAPAGVLAGFPRREYERRGRRFHGLALRGMPPWRWGGPWRCARMEIDIDQAAPPTSWYVDSLAVARTHRRGGVARALLREAERRAREAGCDSLSLDTAEANRPARALYESWGMRVHHRAAVPPAARVLGLNVRGWVAYVKAL